MATPPDQVETRNSVAGAQLALVAGLLVALLVAMWFFFLRGGGEEVDAVAPPAPITTPTTAPPPPDGGKPAKEPVETFELFAAKDPFDPLVDPNAGAPAPAAPATGGTTDDGTGTDTGSGTDTGGTGTGTNNGISSGGGQDVSGHQVRLIDAFREGGRQRAQVEVDGTVYTVDEGETFAENFQLLSVSGDCATMLYGDDQFTICEGEEILK